MNTPMKIKNWIIVFMLVSTLSSQITQRTVKENEELVNRDQQIIHI